MKIETKYNIGDKVFFLNHNKVEQSMIQSIEIILTNVFDTKGTKLFTRISYILCPEFSGTYYENRLFLTKEDLLNSL